MMVGLWKGDLAKNRSKGQSADGERSNSCLLARLILMLEIFRSHFVNKRLVFGKRIDIRKANILQICDAVQG
jgi:hypothetical protein